MRRTMDEVLTGLGFKRVNMTKYYNKKYIVISTKGDNGTTWAAYIRGNAVITGTANDVATYLEAAAQ